MSAVPQDPGSARAPALRRRMACFLYEGVLLFGVVTAAGLVYGVVTQQRHALVGQQGLQAWLFCALALYFVWFWSRTGQTLAMQTWHIRLVGDDGGPVSRGRALCRYLLSWLWFMPALVTLWLTGLHQNSPKLAGLLIVIGVLVYAALSRLHPQRQYLHDAVCGTRLITWRAKPRP